VLGAIAHGQVIYDTHVYPFKVCEFELAEQLQDYQCRTIKLVSRRRRDAANCS
jgi:hypothetical protein